MQQVCPRESCTGCTACMNVCPHKAISMKADKYGFYYPDIDQDKCVDCGLCVATCPSLHNVRVNYPSECYAVSSNDKDEVKKVASGGMASLLSRYVLDKGGVVYGSDGTDIRNVHHTRIDKIEQLDNLRGSKYVQSYLGTVYCQVKNDLREGKLVLFTGTGCQVAGLKAYLHNKDYENLITVDLVCHGVPSQQMLNDNIDLYTSKKGEPCKVAFRMKPVSAPNPNVMHRITFGWFFQNQPYVDGWKIYKPYHVDPYMTGFIGCLTFRPSCYQCKYACAARCADFTIADFWGLSEKSGFKESDGVSLALLDTKKAINIWKDLSQICKSTKRNVVEAINGNGQLQRPSIKPYTYELFRETYPSKPFKESVLECSKPFFKSERNKRIKASLQNVKKVIKLILGSK